MSQFFLGGGVLPVIQTPPILVQKVVYWYAIPQTRRLQK